jgi:peptide subunit release factor 1 (eRF1)
MLIPKAIYGLITVEKTEIKVGILYGEGIKVLKEFTSGISEKHRAMRHSQRRFLRIIKDGKQQFYRRISENVNELYLLMEDLQGIFIGGTDDSKEEFLNEMSLNSYLREKILGVIDIKHKGKEGIKELASIAKNKVKN